MRLLRCFLETTIQKVRIIRNFLTIRDPDTQILPRGLNTAGSTILQAEDIFSGRLTLGLVAAGVVAKKIISPATVTAKILEIGGTSNLEKAVELAQETKDSIGGILECRASGLPVGLGEPFFGSVESVISSAVFSIPAVKGIEFGAGFNVAKMTGSFNNDCITDEKGTTQTNNSGGINGGISNGNEIVFKVAVKPTPSISLPQETYNFKDKKVENLVITGRHDLCIALRDWKSVV